MNIKVDTKFEVGQVVNVKGTLTQLFIEMIHTVTCTAGTQVTYEGFIAMQEPVWGNSTRPFVTTKAFPKERVSINEILLEVTNVEKV